MIETTRADGISTIRLAHGKANAMDIELLEALRAELRDAADARALIITGTGTIFCAGVDLYRFIREGAPYAERFFPVLSAFIRELFELPMPVVAAANGHAIAGGALIMLACDYRLTVAGKGRIGVPELAVGVPWPAAALEVVRFAVPRQHVQSLVYTGALLLPEDALSKGVVDEVVSAESLMDRARDVAQQLARLPRENFAAAKMRLRADAITRIREAGDDAETMRLWSAPETRERINAYLAGLPKK